MPHRPPPRSRAKEDVLPSPPPGHEPEGESSGISGWLKKLTPAPVITHTPSADFIAALRECAAALSSQSGYHHHELMERAGLDKHTRQGFEQRADYPLLRHLLNIASFLDNMHHSYANPNLMQNEERQLKEGYVEASHILLRYGKKWLESTQETLDEMKIQLDACRQLLGLAADAPWPQDYPLAACLNAAQEAHRDLSKVMAPPQKALETLAQNLPPSRGIARR